MTLLAVHSLLWAAQPSKDTGAPKSADEEWQELKGVGGRGFRGPAGKQTPEEARQEFANDLVADAERLRQFQAKHPEHAQAKEAKRLEALLLLRAGAAGDLSRKERREALVADVRSDSGLSSAARSEVAAFADNLAVRARKLDRAASLEAYEQVVRKLIAEFPDVPTGYESLLRVANARSEEAAIHVARELQDNEGAPNFVRQEARMITARAGLIGKELREVFENLDTNRALPPTTTQPVIFYTWATWSPASLNRARMLTAEAPPGVLLVGINMDPDADAAQTAATQAELKGSQIFDREKRGGPCTQALALTAPGMVVISDATGRITTTSAHRDLKAALAALTQR